ncbi:MAG: hypothetical protein KGJ59_09945 [Bacteroidota bacterium]|nr:hypothetical protein [Bacteroidota bacterium]
MNAFVLSAAGFVLGGIVGFAFGTLQNAALRRNEQQQKAGSLKTNWLAMPGSMSRIALLLIILVVIQIACPLLFEGNIQWLVSAGVILGYGWTLYSKLRHRAVQ